MENHFSSMYERDMDVLFMGLCWKISGLCWVNNGDHLCGTGRDGFIDTVFYQRNKVTMCAITKKGIFC